MIERTKPATIKERENYERTNRKNRLPAAVSRHELGQRAFTGTTSKGCVGLGRLVRALDAGREMQRGPSVAERGQTRFRQERPGGGRRAVRRVEGSDWRLFLPSGGGRERGDSDRSTVPRSRIRRGRRGPSGG